MKIVLLESLAIPKEVLKGFADKLSEKGHQFVVYEKSTDDNILIEHAKDADVIMIANMPLSGNVIRSCSNLKFINVAFTGVDHVDLEAAKECGVKVSNASGYSTQSVAELVICMMLSLLRNMNQVEERCRNAGTKEGLVGRQLERKTVGIVGFGAIGKKVAKLLNAFDCKVIAYSRSRKPTEQGWVDFANLDELLEKSDLITLHCPLTAETRHMINAEKIAKMKSNAILINCARGPVVDYEALANALIDGRIGGAGLDVFETEPPLVSDHVMLHTPNTIVTPHIAFASEESMIMRAEIVFSSLDHWLEGKQVNIIL